MKLFGRGSASRRLAINSAWIFTVFPVVKLIYPCTQISVGGLLGIMSVLFMLIGIYAFYAGLFRLYDWYKGD
ncbi:hypothetical protein [Candidatus Pantoea multigeneris]|uniref:Uncharacterized protein n=1 Tax=Candidatus Pantoea multigeneris TaxID=2608357 RepID=A0ABX0RBF5_9GAMM|nr:hypothetical protein [Pantoea multigeneris]NIF22685.1 hypothetical protein [Pantoea multigeneris]